MSPLLFDRILVARGLDSKAGAAFLSPDYSLLHDPFLLPDMKKAVDRLIVAHKKQEQIVVYGDYDIDGISATALLLDALNSFGFKNVDSYIPNRFEEGYGLTVDATERIASTGTQLIVTVDCGSSSVDVIKKAKHLGVDVIVTDHHSVGSNIPKTTIVVNPKRTDSKYPFSGLAGVGVAFKLVQALQTVFNDNPSIHSTSSGLTAGSGLPFGQEKWLLDLVVLGTVCDVVPLLDENRIFVHFGLKTLAQTKRPGLKVLMAISGVDVKNIDTRSLSFGIGPRMNAAGRLETAVHALELLTTNESTLALEKAEYLNFLNKIRRNDQDEIFRQAVIQVEKNIDDRVLVVSGVGWNHGIVGIVASKLLEKYKKPVFVFEEMGDESKGSARSFGGFSAIDAINYCSDIITSGGGHELAVGVTLPASNIDNFRNQINKFYKSLKLNNQHELLLPKADTTAEFFEITEELLEKIKLLEPFGIGNHEPILRANDLIVVKINKMGSSSQHVKIELQDSNKQKIQFIAFNVPEYYFVSAGDIVSVWFTPIVNEWQGQRSIEGRILHLEVM